MANKIKERWYLSRRPGYSIALPDGMTYVDNIGGVKRVRSVIKFPARGGKLFKTEDEAIQKFIEGHVSFERHTIMRVPTPEEIEEAKTIKAQLAQLEFYQGAVARGADFNFKEMNEANLREVAKEIGAETSDPNSNKKLSKADIVKNIEALVYGKETLEEPDISDEALAAADAKQSG